MEPKEDLFGDPTRTLIDVGVIGHGLARPRGVTPPCLPGTLSTTIHRLADERSDALGDDRLVVGDQVVDRPELLLDMGVLVAIAALDDNLEVDDLRRACGCIDTGGT